MRIAMIGTGYVGLVSGACIADFGHEVTCVDKDGTKISALNSGEIPIYEPGLKDIVQSNVRQGRLQFTTALSEALKGLPVRLERAPHRGAAFALSNASKRARTRSIGSRSRGLLFIFRSSPAVAPPGPALPCRPRPRLARPP